MHIQGLIVLVLISLLSVNSTKNDKSLVGHWSFDGDVQDKSTYAAHGKVHGDPSYVSGPIDGKALDFDGNDFIEIGIDNGTPLHLRELSVGSISLWFKARSWNVDSTMLPIFYYGRTEGCVDAFDATNEGLIIEVGHGGIFPSENVFFTCYDQPCAYPTMCYDSNDGMGRILPDTWYHFVAVVGEDYNTGFLNGKEIDDRRYNFQSDSSSLFFADALKHEKMWIGKGFWKGKEVYFDGLIDDVRIYDQPLSAKDIGRLYKGKD